MPLDENRKYFVTASQAYNVMAEFEKEIKLKDVKKPVSENADIIIKYISSKEKIILPKVGDLKKAGIIASGTEIKEVYDYLKIKDPIFSTGMETAARNIAMSEFLYNPDESYKSKDMERGNLQEGEAIIKLSEHTGCLFENIDDKQYFETRESLGATPDGIEWCGDEIEFYKKSCAEVKNPKDETHMKYFYELVVKQKPMIEVSPLYYWQAQTGMFCHDVDVYHWASYHNGFDTDKNNSNENQNKIIPLAYVKILRNDDHIDILRSRADKVKLRAAEIAKEIRDFNY